MSSSVRDLLARRPATRLPEPVRTIVPEPEPMTERYAAEVERDTARLERAYRDAERRLDRAREKATKVAPLGPVATKRITVELWREVELRMAELAEIERLMQPGNIASARHRGRKSHTKAPK